MGIETIPGTELQFYQVNFDEDGRERTDDPDGLMSQVVSQALDAKAVTDVFLLSHGWKGDIEAARKQYTAWISAAARCEADLALMRKKRPGFSPLMVGLHWPSLPFGGEDMGGTSSFAATQPIGLDGESASISAPESLDDMVARYAPTVANTPAGRKALRTLFESALDNVEPHTLPEAARQAYQVLNAEAGLGAAGVGGAPGADREPFDAEAAYQRAKSDPASFGGSFFSGLLSPLAQLSFWKMKARACTFGESGGYELVAAMQRQTAARGVRFHLMGHSFGCVVMSAVAAGPAGSQRPRPLDSMLLVQGAFSLWSYCQQIPSAPEKSGYFRRLLDAGAVAGPIVSTQSEFDTAVGRLYPIAAGLAGQVDMKPGELPKYGSVGTWGVHGLGVDAQPMELVSVDQTFGFKGGKLYNLECSRIIKTGGGMAGAHSDIAHEELGHAFWSAAMATL